MLAFGLALIAVAQIHRARRRRVDPAIDRTHTPTRSAVRRSIAMWSVVVGLLLVWELLALFSQPRHDHPTISSLTEVLQAHHPTRLSLFALWAWFGWTLAS
jgi:hypothetical protein